MQQLNSQNSSTDKKRFQVELEEDLAAYGLQYLDSNYDGTIPQPIDDSRQRVPKAFQTPPDFIYYYDVFAKNKNGQKYQFLAKIRLRINSRSIIEFEPELKSVANKV